MCRCLHLDWSIDSSRAHGWLLLLLIFLAAPVGSTGVADHVGVSSTHSTGRIGSSLAINLQLVDGSGGSLPQAIHLTAHGSGSSTFCSVTLADAIGFGTQTVEGDLSTLGSGGVTLCDQTAETVVLDVSFAGQPSTPNSYRYTFASGKGDHARVILQGSSSTKICAPLAAQVMLLDASDNQVKEASLITVCASGSSAQVVSNNLTAAKTYDRCVTGRLSNEGTAQITFTDTQAETTIISGQAPGLSGMPQTAQAQWVPSGLDLAHSQFVFDSGNPTRLALGVGILTLRVFPKVACGNPFALEPQDVVTSQADLPLTLGGTHLDPEHPTSYVAHAVLSQCPSAGTPLKVRAAIRGQPLVDLKGHAVVNSVFAQCNPPDPTRTEVSFQEGQAGSRAMACYTFSNANSDYLPLSARTHSNFSFGQATRRPRPFLGS